jgi:hypothetical protein
MEEIFIMISDVSNNQFITNNYNLQNKYSYYNTNVSNLNISTYKTDSLSLSNTTLLPKNSLYNNEPPAVPNEPYKTNFFDRPGVRMTAMMLGTGAVGGGIGYAVGSAFGRAALGAGIGASIGVMAPIAMVAYALWKWGRTH